MADRLTQLQDCLDDLMTQMYATLNYIQTRHPYAEIPGQSDQAPPPEPTSQPSGATTEREPSDPTAGERPLTPPPEQAPVFRAALRELAQGLVLKEQQMEILINSLPGLGNHEDDQLRRMRELEKELRVVERERAEAELERERLVDGLGDVIGGMGRIP